VHSVSIVGKERDPRTREFKVLDLPALGLPTSPIKGSRGMLERNKERPAYRSVRECGNRLREQSDEVVCLCADLW
jgi:hypothetical protein